MWYAIRNGLRLVNPEAELLYQQIYEHFYGVNHIFPDYDVLVPLGNSYIMAITPNNYNVNLLTGRADDRITAYYFFK